MSQSLILISSHPDDLSFLQEIASISGLQFKHEPNVREAINFINQNDKTIIFADVSTQDKYKELEEAVQSTLGLFSEKVNSNRMHFISAEDLSKSSYLISSPLFGHYIARKYGDPIEAGKHYGRIVKMEKDDKAFGVEKFFGTSVKTQKIKFKETIQKQQAVEAVKNYLLAAKFKSRMASVIANAVDELLMNAMFDAPVDDLGKPIFNQTSRAEKIKLEGKHSVEMQIAFDGAYVAVSVSDFFGSLDKNKLLSHISKRYTDEEYKVRTAVAGAGIGLATVFRSGGSLLFSSESRVQTEVVVFFRIYSSFIAFKDQFQFIGTQFYF